VKVESLQRKLSGQQHALIFLGSESLTSGPAKVFSLKMTGNGGSTKQNSVKLQTEILLGYLPREDGQLIQVQRS